GGRDGDAVRRPQWKAARRLRERTCPDGAACRFSRRRFHRMGRSVRAKRPISASTVYPMGPIGASLWTAARAEHFAPQSSCCLTMGARKKDRTEPSGAASGGRLWRCTTVALLLGASGIRVVGYAGQPLAIADEPTVKAAVLRVGAFEAFKSIQAAADAVRDGDTIEVEAGDYLGESIVWTQTNVTIRGIGGRVRILADGQSAEGKAIWVTRGARITVENIDFL